MNKIVCPCRHSDDERKARPKARERVCGAERIRARFAESISCLVSTILNGMSWPPSCKGTDKSARLLTECWHRHCHNRGQAAQDKMGLPGEVSHKRLQFRRPCTSADP